MPRAVSFCTGTVGPLEALDRGVAVEADDEPVGGGARLAQQRDMAGMDQIEAAIGEGDALARGAPALDALQRAFQRHDLRFARQHGRGPAAHPEDRRDGPRRCRACRRRCRPPYWRAARPCGRSAPTAKALAKAAMTVSPAPETSKTSRASAARCSGGRPGSTRVMPRSLRVTSSGADAGGGDRLRARRGNALRRPRRHMPVAAASSPRLGVNRSAPA